MADIKTTTLFVSNLSPDITSSDLENTFSDFGPIKRCFTVKNKKSEKCKGFGYVTFSMQCDAEKAVKEGKSFKGRKLIVKFADRKTKVKNPTDEEAKPKEKITKEERKEKKNKKKSFKIKKHRLIVRNLSFKAAAQDVKSAFGKLGKILDVNIPTGNDGKKKGFCFVQFDNIASASKAIKELNGCQVKGRPVAVDWAVSKQQFVHKKTHSDDESEEDEQQSDTESNSESEITNEKSSPKRKRKKEDQNSAVMSNDEQLHQQKVKKKKANAKAEDKKPNKVQSVKVADEESMDECEGLGSDENGSEDESAANNTGSEADDDRDGSDFESDDNNSIEDEDNVKKSKKLKTKSKVQKEKKDDVGEGKTVFVRNLPYEVEEENLEDCFSQWGEVEYVKLVLDKATQHPKGTAFVKFDNKESADKCVTDCKTTPLVFDGRTIIVFPAMKSSEVTKRTKEEKEQDKHKDGRNLWLVRIGSIRQGTEEANSLSASDMAKRLKIEAVKKQKLKNPSIFVSPTRLCVHNIPVSCDNKKLRSIFLQAAADKQARITECRIMCDMARVNSKGVPKSRGYAFVNFTEHKHALEALMNTNNKSELFGEKKKLIVEFSLENRMALAAKEKRMERLQVKQAMLKGEGKRATYTKVIQQKKQQKENSTAEPLRPPTKGSRALPSHSGPKIRHKPRPQQQQQQKKKHNKKDKKNTLRNTDDNGRGKVKKVKKLGRKNLGKADAFDSLVAKYKAKLTPNVGGGTKQQKGGSKWFQ